MREAFQVFFIELDVSNHYPEPDVSKFQSSAMAPKTASFQFPVRKDYLKTLKLKYLSVVSSIS